MKVNGIWDKVKLGCSWLRINMYTLSFHVNLGLGLNMLEDVQEGSLYSGVRAAALSPSGPWELSCSQCKKQRTDGARSVALCLPSNKDQEPEGT